MTTRTPEELSENSTYLTAFKTALVDFKPSFRRLDDEFIPRLDAVARAYRAWETRGIFLDTTNHYNSLIHLGCTDQEATTIMSHLLGIMLNEEATANNEARKARTLSKTSTQVEQSVEGLFQDGTGI